MGYEGEEWIQQERGKWKWRNHGCGPELVHSPIPFLGAFIKLRKETISFTSVRQFVCLSVRMEQLGSK
jgi:hypothetical protein